MDRFNGLEIPESLADALRPSTLALLVYDMQVGVMGQIPDGRRVLANVLRVLAAAREQRVRTMFLRHYSMSTELAGIYQCVGQVWQRKRSRRRRARWSTAARQGSRWHPSSSRARARQ